MNIDGLQSFRQTVSPDSANPTSCQALSPRAKIPRERSFADLESPCRAKRLRQSRRKASGARSDRSRKGWSPERRARQAALIRSWTPWQRSTGPKTDAGKARCAMNALKHGGRSQAKIREYQRIRYVLRLAAQNIERVRLFIRLRDARPRIKYKFAPIAVPRRTSNGPNTTFPSRLAGEGNRRGGPVAHDTGEGSAHPIRKPRAPIPPVSAPTP